MSQAVLNEKTFGGAGTGTAAGYAAMPQGYTAMPAGTEIQPVREGGMTLGGTVQKSLLFLIVTIGFAFVGWNMAATVLSTSPLLILIGFGILIALSYSAVRNPRLAAPVGFVYSVLMGVWMGAISRIYDAAYSGIVLQAVGASIAVFLGCLILYGMRVVKVTAKFRAVVITATFGVLFLYLAGWILSLFGFDVLWKPGGIAVLVSVVVCIVAALNLFLDFNFIEQGARQGAPKAMEWLGAFGLLTTLVWLYLELLRLLALLQGDR